ncbi:MAG TPA: mechanosensitive ion channel domain-containing protein [Puia sp.]|jgi:small-conductance mechanosensitive channel|nr:mechanosensitive ion channel domain-containing protein [Puia sp.]
MPDQFLAKFNQLPAYLWDGILVALAIIIGLIVKFMLSLLLRRKPRSNKPAFSFSRSMLNRLSQPFTWFLPLLAFNLLLPLMRIRADIALFLNKATEILVAISFANVLIALIKVFEDYVYHTFDIDKADNLKERKIRTQLQFIRRLAVSLVIILTVCAILLSFNNLRKIGTGLLTGVGVGGIIIGFAAQKSLGNFLAGFQIAFTQPLRIDDVLVVEGEWGRVEEITLSYVVLKIWDQRRLILPINYFVEKPFQNWTRNTSDILGTVFLYLDYTIPLEPLRTELTRLLETNPLWDKRINILQVTNASERTIEVRALMSAASSGDAFDLRCDVREGLIKFVQENYPQSLPQTRLASPGQATSSSDPTSPTPLKPTDQG